MVPEILQKDIVLFDTSQTEVESGKIYIVEGDDGEMLCRIYRLPGKKYNLVFANTEIYPSFQIPIDDILIIGKVVWVGRFV